MGRLDDTTWIRTMTYILIVYLHLQPPMQATPVEYTTLAECEQQARFFRLLAGSTTRYECKAHSTLPSNLSK